ncbi:MAG TPA: M28 family peptidase [Bacteroidales bacterium]|nr:M28 family peptidase [Bacteroidales bacterium]
MNKYRLLALTCLLLHGNVSRAQNVDSSMLKKHVYLLASDSLMGRGFGTQGGRMAAEYIEKQFYAIGLKPWAGKYMHSFISSCMMLKTEGVNIIGWVEGADPVLKNEYIVIGAHYDHLAYRIINGEKIVYNGADDNASGVASVIEIGRWLVLNKASLKRSVIIVAFDGEEAGLIGSSYLVNQHILPVDSIKFMFSLDMVGMLQKYGGVDLVGNKTLNHGDEFFAQLAAKYDIKVKKSGRRIEMQTDTQPFGKLGIPAVHVFTSTVSPYHRPEDDADKLDYDGMARIANFVADATMQLSNADAVRPDTWFAAKTLGSGRFSVGYQFGFGNTYHEYKDEFYNSKKGFSFNTGISFTAGLGKNIDLQAGALYQTTGTEHRYGFFRTHEVIVPVDFLWYFGGKRQQLVSPNVYLIGGGYYSRRFAGKVGNGSFNMDNIRKENYGAQFGLGLSAMNVSFQLIQQIAVKSIEQDTKVIPNTMCFSMIFRF